MAMFRNVNVAPIDTSGFERAGAAYGQMFQNVGKTVAETIQKYEDKKMRNEAAKQHSAETGMDPALSKLIFKQDNAFGVWQALEGQKQFAKTHQLQRELAESQIAATAQTVEHAGKTFEGKLDLQALEITGKKQEIEQEKEGFGVLMEQREATVAATQAATAQTKAQTAAIPKELKIATDRLAIAKDDSEWAQAHQLFNQGMAAQQFAHQQKEFNLKKGDLKGKRELERERVNLLANNYAFQQGIEWQAEHRLQGTAEQRKAEFTLMYELKVKEFKQNRKTTERKLNVAEGQLDEIIKGGQTGRALKEAQAGYYDALAARGPTVSSSEWERLINTKDANGEPLISGEERDKLILQRAANLAGIHPRMDTQTQLKHFGEWSEGGVNYATWSKIEGAATGNTTLNNHPVKVKEIIHKTEQHPAGRTVKEISGKDADGRNWKVLLTPEIETNLKLFRQLEQSAALGGGTFNPQALPGSDLPQAPFDFSKAIKDAVPLQ